MAEDTHPSTHPPLPPTTEDDRVSWLRLLRSRRVGVATFFRLLAEHGSAQAALQALPDVARQAGVSDYAPCPIGVVINELKAGQAADARLVFYGQPDYPAALSDIPDPPPFLWVRGDMTATQAPMIAMVGARNASSLGVRMARKLANELSEAGFTVVSGLARGIDTAAHHASLNGGTIAVMAGGVDVIYPRENRQLAQNMLHGRGILLSEQPPGLSPQASHFPRRNRLISGLSQAVIVIEAAAKSGSLITARNALDQGREVLAVPGHPFDARAAGCNMLIRDGARLVRCAADVIEMLPPVDQPVLRMTPGPAAEQPALAGIPDAPPKKRDLRETSTLHQQILQRLGPSPIAEDQLIRDLSAPANAVSPVLVELDVDGQIARQPGGLLARS